MTKISHYEVYVDGGDGWKLLQRYAQEERSKAFNLAKDKENEKLAVKVIKEVFDSSDSSYSETVEYVKGLRNTKRNYTFYSKTEPLEAKGKLVKEKLNISKASQAVFILITIIVVSAVLVNFLGTLAFPIFEMLLPEESVRSTFFIALFVLFIAIAFPLMLKKVPWSDLSISYFNKTNIGEELFIDKARTVFNIYNTNDDFADNKIPVHPEAKISEKRIIINFMAQTLSALSSESLSKFDKLGIKFIVYGAVLELAYYKKLKYGPINSLLAEAMEILDGKEEDLVNFYQAKRAYKDTQQALHLAGLGAFLMDKIILKNPVDKDLLIRAIKKWRALDGKSNDDIATSNEAINTDSVEIKVSNIITVSHNIKLFDATKKSSTEKKQVNAIESIVNRIAKKLGGKIFIKEDKQISFEFLDITIGIAFAKQALKEINEYIYRTNDENIIFNVKINLIKKQDNNDNALYIKDVLSFTNDDEILTTLNIVNEAKEQTSLEFLPLGKKLLPSVGKNVELYKIL